MKYNEITLKGPVIKSQIITKADGTQEVVVVMAVIRGFRNVGDGRDKIKIDRPVIMSRNKDMINEMATWKKNDIVYIEGAVATRTVMKGSICPFCKKRNNKEGLTTYIEPIFVEKEFTVQTDAESIQYLNKIREISNKARVSGNLYRDPKKITIKNGPQVTQYPIAAPRKYTIREDPAYVDTDFPWVKAYGQNALGDRNRLKLGSEIFLDGLIQTRSINQKTICEECGKRYEWKDRALELVPYDTEYVANYYTQEEAIKNEEKRKQQRLKSLGLDKFISGSGNQDYDDDDITDDDINAGMDDLFDE